MLRRLRGLARMLAAGAAFAIVSVLCGLLVAGLAVPVAAGSGIGAEQVDRQLAALPTEMDTPEQAQRTKVLDADGEVLAYFYDENRVYVGLGEVAPVMRTALLAIEDHRYYQHGAFDPVGTLRAFLTNTASGATVQGGSSITQQYVKMVQVNQASLNGNAEAAEAAQAPTYQRKMTELRYAIALEQQLSKDEILERYLNLVYFGDGAYGVEAAARHYFNTTAAELTLPQAALLAGLVQSPDAYNPVQYPEAATKRRNLVIDRMAELGEVTEAAATQARQASFAKREVRPADSGCVSARYAFVCDYVRRTLLQLPSLGDNPRQREQRLDRGGLTVQTSIDPRAQDAAQRAISDTVGAKDPLISVMNMIEPGTGKVLAMAQSRATMGNDTGRGQTFLNYSVRQPMGGSAGFQAGSTFKAFVAAAALDQGTPIAKQYTAKEKMDFGGSRFQSCKGPSWIEDWTVGNSTGRNGRMDMAEAAAYSVNTYFVQLELDAGVCASTRMASRVGARSATDDRSLSYYQDKPSFTLGTAEVSPLSMANAYATFAAGGIGCTPVIITGLRTAGGDELDVPEAECERVLSAEVAAAVNQLLTAVPGRGSPEVRLPGGRDQAGKTGTIESSEAVWYVGYTPEVAGAAMISVDRTRKPWIRGKKGHRSNGLSGYRVPSTGIRLDGSGGVDAGARIWQPATERYLKGSQPGRFTDPPKDLRYGPMITVPDVRGLPEKKASAWLTKIGLTVETERRRDEKIRSGRVLRVVPRHRDGDRPRDPDKIRKYGTVRMIISSGKPEPKKDSDGRGGGGGDDRNAGDQGSRNRNPGGQNSDNQNSRNQNSGDQGSGDQNSGNRNAGNPNSGDRNGSGNRGDGNGRSGN